MVLEICHNVKYIGVIIDNNLRFESHVDNLVTKASQRMHIVRSVCYTSTKLLSSMLFKGSIISILTYYLPMWSCLLHQDMMQAEGKD